MNSLYKGLISKLKEAAISVFPVTLIVIAFSYTKYVSISTKEMIAFLLCAVFLVVGIALFNLGADLAMSPMGEHIGAGLTKTGNVNILLSVCFVMGVLITVAEPDLSVLAEQVKTVMNPTLLIVVVGLGVGIFLSLGIVKIIGKKNLSLLLMFFYMILFAGCSLLIESGKSAFVPLSFDSGGVTTGPITVPFIMALGVGIATIIGGKDSNENSFGLIALCSVGPILAMIALSIGASGSLTYKLPDYDLEYNVGKGFAGILLASVKDVAKALALILCFFLLLQFFVLNLSRRRMKRIFVGIGYTFVGLVVFLTSVTVGFMPIGFKIGMQIADAPKWLIIGAGFVLGMVVVLAEPAVHVLKKQVEQVTNGTVTALSMLLALSIGVGVSIGLSMLRMIVGFSVLYYLIPGYLISLGLSFFVPGIYTAIAFDSGGVASGPLTSSFILPLMIGACETLCGTDMILSYAFGVVAMVAMTPLITIQALGFKAVLKKYLAHRRAMKRIFDADDEQIIYFAGNGGNNGR